MQKKDKKSSLKQLAIDFRDTKSEKLFNELYRKLKPGIYNFINNMVRDEPVSNSLVEETLTIIYNKIAQYNEKWHITTRAYRIAYTTACYYLRKPVNSTNKPVRMSMYDTETHTLSKIEFANMDEYKDELIKKEEKLAEESRLERVAELVQHLEPKIRDIVVDKFYNDMNNTEIAKKHGISTYNVVNALKASKEFLIKYL